MPTTKHVRRSMSLPTPIAKQVERMAKSQRLSDNRILVELIELGMEAGNRKRKLASSWRDAFVASLTATSPTYAHRHGVSSNSATSVTCC